MVWSRNFDRRARMAARSLSSVRRSVSLCAFCSRAEASAASAAASCASRPAIRCGVDDDEPARLLGGGIELLEGDQVIEVLGHVSAMRAARRAGARARAARAGSPHQQKRPRSRGASVCHVVRLADVRGTVHGGRLYHTVFSGLNVRLRARRFSADASGCALCAERAVAEE